MRRVIHLATCMLLVALAGCYSYTVAPPESVPPGATVRARISATEAERLSEVIRREDRVLAGALVQSDAESILLSVPSAVGPIGTSPQRLHQRLTIPRSEIVELEIRKLDPWRTAGVVVAATAVAGYVVFQAFDAADSSPGGDRPGGEQARIPLGSFPIW